MRETEWGLVARHLELDAAIKDEPHRPFISDWNGTHPFAAAYVPDHVAAGSPSAPIGSYPFFDHAVDVTDAIGRMHERFDGICLARDQIIAGAGSSSFIAAFVMWLIERGIEEVFYLPPLYYTFHYFFRLLKIRARPVSGRQGYEPQFTMNLPAQRAVLVLCDPIWYAGKRLTDETVAHIAAWQRATGSTVFVDGSFQYMQWSGERRERTATLDADSTFRLVCPTKFLGTPAYRLSYLLHPAEHHAPLLQLYESLLGATSWTNIAYARHAMGVMSALDHNRQLTDYLRDRYERMSARRLFETTIAPDCGYFVFVRLLGAANGYLSMDQDYFEQRRYPGYVRLNLFQADRLLGSGE